MAYHFNDNVYTKSFTPREYQVELLDAAKERNIIVCLGSGPGKIFIATKLIQELANAVRRPFCNGCGKRTLYLVDTVALVAQQAAYIRHLTDLSVGEYSSSEQVEPWEEEDWEREFSKYQVVVMTSDICLNILQCCFLRFKDLNLIVLDECHRAVKKHPMRQIMREFELSWEQPRILGLTSPLLNSNSDPSRLEGEIRRLELTLRSTAETASDIVSVLRYCAKPKELVVEYALQEPGGLDHTLETIIVDAIAFIDDHRYDPSEVYEEEFLEELKGIPDPKIDPSRILEDFLNVLRTLGAWCADRAAYLLLIQLEKLKVKTPYERHFLLLCAVSTVMVRVRAICDDFFKAFEEKERIYKFSSPKVLRLLEVLKQFKPVKSPESKGDENSVNGTQGDLVVARVEQLDASTVISLKSTTASETEVVHGLYKTDSQDANCKSDENGTVNHKNSLMKCVSLNATNTAECDESCKNETNNVVSSKTDVIASDVDNSLSNNIKMISSLVNGTIEMNGINGEVTEEDVANSEMQIFKITEKPLNGDFSTLKSVNFMNNGGSPQRHSLENCVKDILNNDKIDNLISNGSCMALNVIKNMSPTNGVCSILNMLPVVKNEQYVYNSANGNVMLEDGKSTKISKETVISGDGETNVHQIINCDNPRSKSTDNNVIIAKNCNQCDDNSKSRPANYPTRTRGYKFFRKGHHRDDGTGRPDAQCRQHKNYQQDDVDALCGIIFVEHRFTAKILYHLLNELRRYDEDLSFLTAQYTVDKVADPLTDPREAETEHRKQEDVLKRFRMRECNLLIGTSVLEEGIDIPKCNLVVHFDVPPTYRSYVQSKGRARAQEAYYVLMIREDRTPAFTQELAQYYEIEQMLLRKCANQEPPDHEEKEADEYNDAIEAYRPANSPSNASVNMATAVALVNRYCAKLPSDTFTRLTPISSIKHVISDCISLYICTVRLPINSPVKQDIMGLPMPSQVLARRIAALETCQVLHRAHELDDNLLPVGKESFRIHEEEETSLAQEELEEMVPRDSNEPRPGTTKRRQYYYKRIAEALTECRPTPGQPAFLYHISMVLTCPLPEEQNTRGRKIYPPEDSPQGFGILTLKQIPKICPFPIFTRSGEVSVKLELSGPPIILTEEKLEKIVTFLNYTFTSVLRLQKYLMMFDPKASENSYFIVPTRNCKESPAEVDWEFLERIFENRDLRPHPVPHDERECFAFEATKYHDAVIMPWYRNQDQPQYFYVAEICGHLNPKSSFPGSEYKTFDEYYFKKYIIEIQNTKQPLLDVDHTSARLNFLTPRYVNRKGVALPTSSEETKRAKRENLEQKQILVPELCTVHPFPASLWRKAVCLPCILYRINALLLADQIRRQVARDIALGLESLPEDFEWPPLDFGWSLADVLKKSKENAKNSENKVELLKNNENEISGEKGEEENEQNKEIGIKEDREQKRKSANDILTEEEKKLQGGDWMEIGTWSNDMANHQPHQSFDLLDIDEFDPTLALPSNLTLLGENDKLAELHVGGSDWGTGISARRRERVRYGSPSSWMGGGCFGGLEQDLEGFETDDSYSEPGNDYDQSDSSEQGTSGLRIEFMSDNVAEAVEDEQETKKRERRNAVRRGSTSSANGSEIPWDWENDGGNDDDEELEQLSIKYAQKFVEATKSNQSHIETSDVLIRKDIPFIITRKCNQATTQTPNIPIEIYPLRLEKKQIEVTPSVTQIETASFIAGQHVVFRSPNSLLSENVQITSDSGVSECDSSQYSTAVLPVSTSSESLKLLEAEIEEDIISKFSFDAQPDLEGHPGPSPSVILQALTMSNANDGINLERLETIGDSFLKYAITTYLYCTYDNIHEGKLSHLRSKQVSNLNLYRLGRRKVFGESMIATKFEPHDNWLPPCYYVPRALEQALIEAGVPASHWNQADLPALRELSRDEICQLVRERSEKLRASEGEDTLATPAVLTANMENLPCFIPYNLITQHSIPDKSVADCVEALIGAYLIACGPRGALLFMAWLGICVLPKDELILPEPTEERTVGSLAPVSIEDENSSTVWKQVRYGSLKAPRSPLLRNISNPEVELERLLDGYEVFERRIGYKFCDRSYLLQALTHASYSPSRLTDCYQRLEFLGDAVLDYLITRHLYEDSRQHSPGALTDLRSALVNNTIFASLAVRYGFHKFFRHLSPGLNEVVDRFVRIQEENGHTISEEYYLIEEEECEEAEDVEVPKALGDVFESVAGAIFLDSNMSLDAVWRVYYCMMKAEIEQFSTNVPKSPIRELLELEPETAKFGKPEKLADGRRVRVTVEVFGKGTFKGIGRNYRIAKCTAAKCALKQLKKKGLLARKM